jgi:WD repeat-containing protein mio
MQLDAVQSSDLLSPLLINETLTDIPLFGNEKKALGPLINRNLQPGSIDDDLVVDTEANGAPLPAAFADATTLSERLRALRNYSREHLQGKRLASQPGQGPATIEELDRSLQTLSTKNGKPPSNRELHESLLGLTQGMKGFPKDAQAVLDHVMLLRAKERYLFDFGGNRSIVSDDPWLRDLWDWVAGSSFIRTQETCEY